MISVRSCSAFFSVLFLAVAISHADPVDNPRYKAWSSFKVGSTETLTGTISARGVDIQLELKRTLVELTKDHAIVESVTTTTVAGQKRENPATRETIDAKSGKPDWKEVGEEEVKAMDKTFKCKVYEGKQASSGSGGTTTESDAKFYANTDVPGGIVQIKVTAAGGRVGPTSITYLLSAYQAK